MFKNLFRKLPLPSLDESFWFLLDDAEKNGYFRVYGRPLNLRKALNNQFRSPILDFLVAHYSYIHCGFDLAADAINSFDANIISREGKFWSVSYDPGVVVEVSGSAYCELRGYIYSAFDDAEEEALQLLTQSVLLRVGGTNRVSSNREVYSFRRINEYTLADLRNNTITVANPLEMNDPYDSPFYDAQEMRFRKAEEVFRHYSQGNTQNYKRLKKSLELTKRLNGYYRIRCFVEDNPRNKIQPLNMANMWAAYANNAQGICVKYSLSPKFQNYADENGVMYLHEVNYVDSFDLAIGKSLTLGESFFMKNSCWSNENEVRLLTFIPGSEKKFLSIPLDEESHVTDVYFGLNCYNIQDDMTGGDKTKEEMERDRIKEEEMNQVIDALKPYDVQFHSMEKNEYNYYVPAQIDHLVRYSGDTDAIEKWFNS